MNDSAIGARTASPKGTRPSAYHEDIFPCFVQQNDVQFQKKGGNTVDTPSDTQGHHLRRAGNARHVSRFNARWTAEQRSIIERAAALSGQSVSQFVLAAAHHAALDLIQQREVIVLSLQDSRKIREALENPPEPSADLRRAAEQYQALVREEN